MINVAQSLRNQSSWTGRKTQSNGVKTSNHRKKKTKRTNRGGIYLSKHVGNQISGPSKTASAYFSDRLSTAKENRIYSAEKGNSEGNTTRIRRK
jgi:hypothetical protein